MPSASTSLGSAKVVSHSDRDLNTPRCGACLDAATAQQISGWLQAHAGTYKRVNEAPPQDRITRSTWFERKHRKIDPSVWKLASVKSAGNCAACHTGAERGVFDDDQLQYPAGMDLRLRRSFND